MHVIFSGMYRPCALLLSAVSIMVFPAVGQAQDTTIQEERAREAERVREAERTREEAERTRELQRTREAERIRAEERARVYEDERARAYQDRRDHHERDSVVTPLLTALITFRVPAYLPGATSTTLD